MGKGTQWIWTSRESNSQYSYRNVEFNTGRTHVIVQIATALVTLEEPDTPLKPYAGIEPTIMICDHDCNQ